MPLNKPKKAKVVEPPKEKNVVKTPPKPLQHAKQRKTSTKIENKIAFLERQLKDIKEQMDSFAVKPVAVSKEAKYLVEAKGLLRTLTSWQRFSNKTAFGRKVREFLDRCEKND